MTIPDLSLEKKLWENGFLNVAGVDEAGRGPWAGPLTAGAVIIHRENQVVSFVRDSKKMSPWQRERAFDAIKLQSTAYGIGIVSVEEIDGLGITKAVQIAMGRALEEIQRKIKISYVIPDGSKVSEIDGYQCQKIKAGGLYHYSISAASVLAKVTRDRLMKELANKYPEYGFEKHVGYGTKMHRQKLEERGLCPIHRQSFAPIKRFLS